MTEYFFDLKSSKSFKSRASGKSWAVNRKVAVVNITRITKEGVALYLAHQMRFTCVQTLLTVLFVMV
jgi:hypothetical protein